MRPLDPNAEPCDLAVPAEIREGVHLQYVLYRFHDASRRLLYVGITTGNPRARWRAHQRKSPWWQYVAFVSVEHMPTWKEARAAERAAIRSEDPLHNIADRPGWYPARDAGERRRARHGERADGEGGREEIPVTQARMMFKELVDQVAYGGRPVIITRRDKAVAGVISAEDFELLMNHAHGSTPPRRPLR
ncbi:type II toxin-antitoxin system prevent-host-death family antitoxin [Actinomadura sp. 9N407]|uniref:type II toxin-antitoxin system prevent-host-death family antitoxin n=1 Tax=Actinomadura sp. 9N407 TaxID=3375154 RepID=UPI0037AD2DC0